MTNLGSLIEARVTSQIDLGQPKNKNDYYHNFKTQFES